jgi:hypothetical protein
MTELDPPTPSTTQRATAIKQAMEEISKICAARQVNDALHQQNGPSVTARLATVRSGPDRGLFWRPFQKLGPHGPAPPDRSPDCKTTVRSGPVSSLKMETAKKTGPYGLGLPDRSPVWTGENWDWTVRPGLRLDHKLSFAFPSKLEHVSVTPRRYLPTLAGVHPHRCPPCPRPRPPHPHWHAPLPAPITGRTMV